MNNLEEIRSKAYAVAKKFGEKKQEEGVNWESIDYLFNEEGFNIEDDFQVIYKDEGADCVLKTTIMYNGEPVYLLSRNESHYVPGKWENKLNELYDKAKQ
ncbi:hypothetical protein HY837_05270 [archaeon]|nr:hypothetical protein [archaeon]